MIGLLQRVSKARVSVGEQITGEIGPGLLVLVCAERRDTLAQAESLLDRLLNYRVFADDKGRMNRSLRQVAGGLLLVPQFTLAADTRSGLRPSFTPAAPPDIARGLFESLLDLARQAHAPVAAGVFGADMQVALVNDGPVTFWLRADPPPLPADPVSPRGPAPSSTIAPSA
jgi:D-tyrosyl-tRNA(Tyr) deacylase